MRVRPPKMCWESWPKESTNCFTVKRLAGCMTAKRKKKWMGLPVRGILRSVFKRKLLTIDLHSIWFVLIRLEYRNSISYWYRWYREILKVNYSLIILDSWTRTWLQGFLTLWRCPEALMLFPFAFFQIVFLHHISIFWAEASIFLLVRNLAPFQSQF